MGASSGGISVNESPAEKHSTLLPFGDPSRRRRLSNVADMMVGSFYDSDLEEGCAFEELISFHGLHGRAREDELAAR